MIKIGENGFYVLLAEIRKQISRRIGSALIQMAIVWYAAMQSIVNLAALAPAGAVFLRFCQVASCGMPGGLR